MKIVDVIIQSILMLAALASLPMMGREALVWIAFIQFFLGAWQLLSAIIHSFHRDTQQKKTMLGIYWIAVAAYFVVLGLIALFDRDLLLAVWFFCAWIIAVYYYVFCFRLVLYRGNEKRSFLDVAN
jgi:hypothetical protein